MATWTLSVSLNICLCIDLVLMIKYPFGSKSKRIAHYVFWSVLFAIVVGAVSSYERQ